MPLGVEGRSESGVIFSETSYASSILGSFNTGGRATGTFPDERLKGQRLVYFVAQNSSQYGGPDVTLDPSTGVMSWSYSYAVQGQAAPAIPSDEVQYGGY